MKNKIERYHKVPVDYFEKLTSNVLDKRNESIAPRSVFSRLTPWTRVAAAVVLLLLIGVAQINNIEVTEENPPVAALDNTHLEFENTLYGALLMDEEDTDQTLYDLAELLSDIDMYEQ